MADRLALSIRERARGIEASSLFTLGEKIQLVRVLLGQQHIADLGVEVGRRDSHTDYLRELDRLGFATVLRGYDLPADKYGAGWVQVGVSFSDLACLSERGMHLSPLEAAILYGYPVSMALMLVGLESATAPFDATEMTFARYFLGEYRTGLRPSDLGLIDRQQGEIAALSPRIAAEAGECIKAIVDGRLDLDDAELRIHRQYLASWL